MSKQQGIQLHRRWPGLRPATTRGGGGPRRRQHNDDGFTLMEILIVVVILGILAAIVVPQFSNASHVARENTLKDDLRYLRTQIAVFKAQHFDIAPGYPGGKKNMTPTETDFVQQMTRYSNESCGTNMTGSTSYPLGPYLQKMPVNPLTTNNAVLIIPNGQPLDKTNYRGPSYGWIYKPETQEIIANSSEKDGNGVSYMQY
jgi:general secretion pathway protein G